MTILYLEALAAIAASLPVLIADEWMVQQRTGRSGWVDTSTFFPLPPQARSSKVETGFRRGS